VLRGEQARLAEAVPALEQFVERMPLIAAWRTALANAYAEAGRHVEARQQLELVAAGDFADIPRDVLWTSAMHALAETVALLRDRAYAERVYELLLPYGDRCVVLVVGAYLGPVARLLGRLAAVAGWPADAARHFEHAMEISTRVGSEPWLATTRHEYAELLLAEGCEHAARARKLAAQALASADRLGMPALKARARRTDFTVR
jgi:eukaryotic-like serine/threonine-protein kinase